MSSTHLYNRCLACIFAVTMGCLKMMGYLNKSTLIIIQLE
ncbi:hypothetical protein S7335_1436 [Synechococcus sp. PCC 7335]|nr:hypothetical protein S7335_1436 [Synechococcus sp. PCC 7335]